MTIWLLLVFVAGALAGAVLAAVASAGEARRREARITAKARAVEAGIRVLVASTGRSREYWFSRYFDGRPPDTQPVVVEGERS